MWYLNENGEHKTNWYLYIRHNSSGKQVLENVQIHTPIHAILKN